jgi:hypothetical protein
LKNPQLTQSTIYATAAKMSTLGLVEIRERLEPPEGHLTLLFYPQSGLIFKKTKNVGINV